MHRHRKVFSLLAAVTVPFLIIAGLQQPEFALLLSGTVLTALAYLVSSYSAQRYLFLLLALLLPFSTETSLGSGMNLLLPTEPMLGLVVLVWIFDMIQGRCEPLLTSLHKSWQVIPLLLVFLITTFTSSMLPVSLKFTLVSILYGVVFLMILPGYLRRGAVKIHQMLSLYSLSLILVMGFGFYRFASLGFNPKVIKGVFEPFYADHTVFGAASAILCVYWLALAARCGRGRVVFARAAIGLLFIAAVVFSSSRAALWSLLFASSIAVLLKLRLRLWHYGLLVMALAAVVYMYRFKLGDELAHIRYDSGDTQLSIVEQAKSVGNVSTDVSNLERLNRWQAGLRMWLDKPLVGFGPGTFQFQYIPYQDPRFMNRLSVTDPWHVPENSGGSAHSEYILMLAESGIAGILAMLLFWGWLLFIGLRRAWSDSAIPFLALSTYLFHALFNNFLSTDKFAFLFYIMAAILMILAAGKNGEKQEILPVGR